MGSRVVVLGFRLDVFAVAATAFPLIIVFTVAPEVC